MAALNESVAAVRANRGEDADVHEMAKRPEKKQPAEKTAAKKQTPRTRFQCRSRQVQWMVRALHKGGEFPWVGLVQLVAEDRHS